jgi:hypothetical protein
MKLPSTIDALLTSNQAVLDTLITQAQQGDSDVQFDLEVLHLEGLEVPQDYVQAAQWWYKAAEAGILLLHGSPQAHD